MAKKMEFRVDAPPVAVYEALRQAVARDGYHLRRADGASLTLQFNAKRHPKALRMNMSVSVLQGDFPKTSRLVFTGRPANSRQLYAWGEERGVAYDVLNEIRRFGGQVPRAPIAEPSPAPETDSRSSSPTRQALIADLERLAALHTSGALDDAEFKLAKERLLQPEAAQPDAGHWAFPAVPEVRRQSHGRAGVLGPAAAGVVGGMVLSNLVGPGQAAAAGTQPLHDHMTYHDTLVGPDGETMTVDGTLDSTTTFDANGDAHMELHDQGSIDLGGDTYSYDDTMDAGFDLDGGGGDGGGGLLDLFGGLFG